MQTDGAGGAEAEVHGAASRERAGLSKTPQCLKQLLPGGGSLPHVACTLDEAGLRRVASCKLSCAGKFLGEYRFNTKSFGFGPQKQVDRRAALESALSWIWWKHAAHVGDARLAHIQVSVILEADLEGTLDPREEIFYRGTAKWAKVAAP